MACRCVFYSLYFRHHQTPRSPSRKPSPTCPLPPCPRLPPAAPLELYAVHGLGFSRNRFWQFKRLADDLDRLPALHDAVTEGRVGWTKAQQVARIATPATESSWVERA